MKTLFTLGLSLLLATGGAFAGGSKADNRAYNDTPIEIANINCNDTAKEGGICWIVFSSKISGADRACTNSEYATFAPNHPLAEHFLSMAMAAQASATKVDVMVSWNCDSLKMPSLRAITLHSSRRAAR